MLLNLLRKIIWKLIHPKVEEYVLSTPKIYGSKERVNLSTKSNINNAILNTASGNINIEDYVFFGHNVLIITGSHNYKKHYEERMLDIPNSGNDIIIKKGAWIASGVIVVGPCVIGENAVVGANSLVIRDVPPNTIYGGVPAKFIKNIDA